MRHIVTLLVLGCTAIACGGSSLSAPKVAEAEGAISAADAVGAGSNPQASLHLKMARDRLAEARALLEDGEEEDARLVLDGAKADAELALLVVRASQARAAAEAARRNVDELSPESM